MKEQKNILAAFKKIDLSTRKAALATVVNVRGSSYRSPGARMLIQDDGHWTGSISGGCLEGDALRKARAVMQLGKPQTVTYDTREESNQNLGIGLGCNGVIDVLIEPIDQHDRLGSIQLFESIIKLEEPVALATVFQATQEEFIGRKLLLAHDRIITDTLVDRDVRDQVLPTLQHVFSGVKSQAVKLNTQQGTLELFIELIQPVITVMIFGGGFDARPVSQLAKSLGWNVTVTDECVAHIAPVFFPDADQLSLCNREFVDREFSITPFTACVLMSHNYEYDRDVLKKLLQSPAPYIGILGPRKRFDKMCSEFAAAGFTLTESEIQRIHSPIGLDIGAETPDEIAVSIIAEIQGKFSGRSGGFLKYRQGPIHQRDGATDQVFKQVYIRNDSVDKSVNG